MQQLSEDIGRYIANTIDLEQLCSNFRSAISNNPQAQLEASTWLSQSLDSGRLSPSICEKLRGVLSEQQMTAAQATLTRTSLPPAQVQPPARIRLAVGSFLGSEQRYELQTLLGEGGMGQVFKARDRLMENTVALKVLGERFAQDPDAFKSLQYETKRAQELQSPNVVKVFNLDRDGDIAFMLMEYLEGETLDHFLRARGPYPMPVAEAWPILLAIGSALKAAHEQRLVHSDLKPGNVFVSSKGKIKVLDFGIARQYKKSTDATIGGWSPEVLHAYTPPYASLEQILGTPADPRDDIYAYGCVAYRVLAGVHPFGEASADLAMQSRLAPTHLKQLSSRQWNAIRHALAFKRDDRTPNIEQFLKEFEPPSRWRKYRMPLIVGALCASAGVLYLSADYYRDYFEGKFLGLGASQPVKRVKLTAEQKHDVDDQLFLANDYLSGVQRTDPAEQMAYVLTEGANNVNQILDSVLSLDPGNETALKLKQTIANLYADKAREQLHAGNSEVAATLIRNARKVADNRALFRLQQEVCNSSPLACKQVQN